MRRRASRAARVGELFPRFSESTARLSERGSKNASRSWILSTPGRCASRAGPLARPAGRRRVGPRVLDVSIRVCTQARQRAAGLTRTQRTDPQAPWPCSLRQPRYHGDSGDRPIDRVRSSKSASKRLRPCRRYCWPTRTACSRIDPPIEPAQSCCWDTQHNHEPIQAVRMSRDSLSLSAPVRATAGCRRIRVAQSNVG